MLWAAYMCEFTSLDRCAAYVTARAALISIQYATADWPVSLADRARHGATDTLQLIAAAISCDPASSRRRHCLREAIRTALGVAATVDVACTMGFCGDGLVDVQRVTGRTVALLGMFLHASTAPIPAASDRMGHGHGQRPRMRDTPPSPARPR